MNLALRSLSIYSLTCSATAIFSISTLPVLHFLLKYYTMFNEAQSSPLITPCKDINVLSFDSHNLFFLCGAECATD